MGSEDRAVSAIFIILLLAFFSAPAFAVTNINACTNLNTPGETYVMTGSVTSTQSCMNFTAAGVTLDCNSFAITGTNASGRAALNFTTNSNTAVNCRVSNYDYGAYINATTFANAYKNVISASRINSSGHAAILYQGSSSGQVLNTQIATFAAAYGLRHFGTQTDGLYISGSIFNGTVSGSYAARIDTATHITILNSFFYTQDVAGLYLEQVNSSSISGSTIKTFVKGAGLYASSSSANEIFGNTIAAEGVGLQFVSASTSNKAYTNTIMSNNTGGVVSIAATATNNNLSRNTLTSIRPNVPCIQTIATSGIIEKNIITCPLSGITFGVGAATTNHNVTFNNIVVNSASAAIVFSGSLSSNNYVAFNNLTQRNTTAKAEAAFVINQPSSGMGANNTFFSNILNFTNGTGLRMIGSGRLLNFTNNTFMNPNGLAFNGRWINNTDASSNFSFNTYPNTSSYLCYDSNGDGAADMGTQYPFNQTFLNASLWYGNGSDQPKIANPIPPTGLNWTGAVEINSSQNTVRFLNLTGNFTSVGFGTHTCIFAINGTNYSGTSQSNVCYYLYDGEALGYGERNITLYVIRSNLGLSTVNRTESNWWNCTILRPLPPQNVSWLQPTANNSFCRTLTNTYEAIYQNTSNEAATACALNYSNGSGTFSVAGVLSAYQGFYCYQEKTNSTDCTSDGLGVSMNSSRSGSTGWNTNGGPADVLFDGSYTTGAYADCGVGYGSIVQFYENYTKVPNSDNGTIWQVSIDSSGTKGNISNMSAFCWEAYSDKLRLKVETNTTTNCITGYTNYSCWNGTAWKLLDRKTSGWFHEAGMWWHYPPQTHCQINLTAPIQPFYSINITACFENNYSLQNCTVTWGFQYRIPYPQNCTFTNPPINASTTLNLTLSANYSCDIDYTNLSQCFITVQNATAYYNVSGAPVQGACFQNFADQPTCAAAGAYYPEEGYAWQTPPGIQALYDGNWSSFCPTAPSFSESFFSSYYVLPAGYTDAKVIVGWSNISNETLPIPENCLNDPLVGYEGGVFFYYYQSNHYANDNSLYCYYDDFSVETIAVAAYPSKINLTELAMNYTMGEPYCSVNVSRLPSYTYYTNLTGYAVTEVPTMNSTPTWQFTFIYPEGATNAFIYNGSAYIKFNSSNRMQFRCLPSTPYCQPINQINGTGQAILRHMNNGTATSTWQAIKTAATFPTAILRCGTSPDPTQATVLTTSFQNYSTSPLAMGANNSLYCFLTQSTYGGSYPQLTNLSLEMG